MRMIGKYFPGIGSNQDRAETAHAWAKTRDFNPIVVGLFDSTILVGGGKKAPLPNSLLVIDRATKFGMLKASGMYFL